MVCNRGIIGSCGIADGNATALRRLKIHILETNPERADKFEGRHSRDFLSQQTIGTVGENNADLAAVLLDCRCAFRAISTQLLVGCVDHFIALRHQCTVLL